MAPSRLGRALYAGVLAYTAAENFRELEGRIEYARAKIEYARAKIEYARAKIEYARAKDVPLPDILVPLASGMLLLGSVGVLLWRVPRLATAAIVAWFVGITPTMHDFWNQDEEPRQTEQIQGLRSLLTSPHRPTS